MSTATPTRPTLPSGTRSAQTPAPSASMGLVTIDPIRLVKRHHRILIVSVIFGAMLGTLAHFVILRFSPRYTASVLLESKGAQYDVKNLVPLAQGVEELQRFMGTQVAIMMSRPIIEKAVNDPSVIATDWAKQFVRGSGYQPEDALRQAMNDLSARTVGGTNLFRVSMTYTNPQDTAVIANAVSRVYLSEVKADSNRELNDKREALDKQIRAGAEEIERLTRQRDRTMEEKGISTINRDSVGPDDLKISALNSAIVDLISTATALASQKSSYEAIFAENQVGKFPDDLQSEAKQDPILQGLENQISTLRTDVSTVLQQGYMENHQTVIGLRKRIEATENELSVKREETLRKLFAGLIDRMKTRLEGMAAEKKNLQEEADRLTVRKQELTIVRVRLDRIDKDIDRLTVQQQELTVARDNIDTIRNPVYDRVRVIQEARIPNEVSFPKFQIMLPLGVLLTSGLVVGLIVLRELLDQRVRGPSDLSTIPRLRVLGMIPDSSEDPSRPATMETAFRDSPQGVVTESFRQLRSPIIKRMDQEGMKTLLVLSGNPGSGATTVVSNLAIACSGADERVLVIDANLRRPTLHKVFGVSDGQGLGDCLSASNRVPLAQAVRPTTIPNVSVLTAGSTGTRVPERLSSETMSRLLAEAASQYDRVIIDSAPGVVSGDGLSLANRVDAVVLVVRALSEKRGLVNRLRVQLSETRGELLGVVVNGVRSATGGYFKRNIQATHEYQSAGADNGKA